MKAKLILLGVLTTLTGTIANAQKTSFGLRGGLNLYNITGKNQNGDKLDNKLKTGFNLGVNAEIPIGIDFFIQPGVLISAKGASDFLQTKNDLNLNYVEVPINLLYKPDLGKGKLLLGFGPYIAFGISGKYKADNGGKRDVKFKNDITLAEAMIGENYYLKGLDAGGNFLFGYEWANRFSVQLNAGLGLVNIYPKIDGETIGKTNWKNTGFGVSIGYRFAK
jgi:hypothetical protein